MTREDAEQEAFVVAVRRGAEGYADSHLAMRVWGDLKDKYGRDWRVHFALAAKDRPFDPDRELVVTRRSTGAVIELDRRVRAGTHVVRNEPGESFVFDVTDRALPDPSVVMDVRDAIARLTPSQRHVVEECGLKGRSQADVAAERGVSAQAVKLVYMRARRKLAEMLSAYAPEDDE